MLSKKQREFIEGSLEPEGSYKRKLLHEIVKKSAEALKELTLIAEKLPENQFNKIFTLEAWCRLVKTVLFNGRDSVTRNPFSPIEKDFILEQEIGRRRAVLCKATYDLLNETLKPNLTFHFEYKISTQKDKIENLRRELELYKHMCQNMLNWIDKERFKRALDYFGIEYTPKQAEKYDQELLEKLMEKQKESGEIVYRGSFFTEFIDREYVMKLREEQLKERKEFEEKYWVEIDEETDERTFYNKSTGKLLAKIKVAFPIPDKYVCSQHQDKRYWKLEASEEEIPMLIENPELAFSNLCSEEDKKLIKKAEECGIEIPYYPEYISRSDLIKKLRDM